jgi:hypothetical protein
LPDGGTGQLVCIQDASRPGSPTGENPRVFFATATAIEIEIDQATLTRQPGAEVIQLP